MRTPHSILGLLAVAFTAAVAGEAWAACGSSDRKSHRDSECLSAWWDNNTWPSPSPFGVQNLCPDWGKVVAKIDLKDTGDKTWHLNDGIKGEAGRALTSGRSTVAPTSVISATSQT